ncbi:MAG: hypothetical protein HOF41_02405, partial [Candidatus Marinimicrobia bacterium]|nr:hypothetical protein [Candidatus Neomarinimicrobiota bacterium]
MKIYKVNTKRYTDEFLNLEPIGYYPNRKSAVEFMNSYLNSEDTHLV